ncbi:MAG: hypothetical protein QW221_01860 [Candidatus Korarchaeum sp.]
MNELSTYDEPELIGEAEGRSPLPRRSHPAVRRIAESLGVPEEVERTANNLLLWYKLVKRRRATPPVSLASIVLASRMHGVAIPIKSLNVSGRALMRALGELKSLARKEDDWDSYLNYVMTRLMLALSLENKHLVRERILVRAKRELRVLRGRAPGKNPLGVVALAVYSATKGCGLRVSLDTVARCSGVHRNTLYRIARGLRDGG